MPLGCPFIYIDKYKPNNLTIKNESIPVVLKGGFFATKPKTTITQELTRITNQVDWKYIKTKDTAFLENENKEIITTIFNYLNINEAKVRKGKNPKNGNFLIHLFKPNLEKLEKMSTIIEKDSPLTLINN